MCHLTKIFFMEHSEKSAVPELSVVILCYQAGESVKQFVERVQSLFKREGIINYELILVSNYFSDNHDPTPLVVKEIAANYDRVLSRKF